MKQNAGRTGRRLVRPAFAFGVAIPILLLASASGPEPASNGDPYGDADSCARSSCHVGTAVNGGGGRASITSSATSYVPGVDLTFTLTVSDAQARVYGFQVSALTQGSNQQAGSFTRGAGQFVICSNNLSRPQSGCPASAPVEYLEHANPVASNVFTITWTPPASNVGPVGVHFAANEANGNGNADRGDHIYTGSLTLGAPAGTPKPVISAAISAGAFGASDIFTGGSWIEIYGTNLAATTRQWNGDDFSGSNAPTTLDGVSVTINGRPAYVWVLVHGATDQLNVQAPTDGAISGKASIVVTVNGQASTAFTMLEDSRLAPGLLAPENYRVAGKQYIVALFSDGAYACPPGSFEGLICRLPKPGDSLTFYGVGFGATSNGVPAGMVAPGDSRLANAVTWQFGSTNATVAFAGLAPGAVGLYQFNVVVPNVGPGDYLLTVRVGGIGVPQTMSLRIGS